MNLFYKTFFLLLLIFIAPIYADIASLHGLDGFVEYKIDATKNARLHSNMGNIYFSEKNYIAALKEYQIAYNLTYDTSGSSTYLYNIARCFMEMNEYELAKNALIGATQKDCINITYYESLVDCYIKLNTINDELEKCLNDTTNPYNRIIAGLIYLKTDKKTEAKILFDEFVSQNPKMIITQDIKNILRKL